MRTRNDRDVGLFGSPHGAQATWVKVEIDRTGSGSWVDITQLEGDDWLLGFAYRDAIGTPAMAAVLTLTAHQRGNPAYSILPTMSASPLNVGGVLLQKFRRIRASVANVPIGSPRPSSYDEIFDGRIDKWSSDGKTVNVECRCLVQDLMSRFCEQEFQYGDSDPTTATAADIEEVIQNILDDHLNSTASAPRANPLATRTTDGDPWQLYSDDGDGTTPFKKSTGAAVMLYMQKKEPIWQAIKRNADCIQWRLSRRWLNSISDWALVLEQPTRAGGSSVLTIDPKTSQARIRKLSFDGDVVRNVVEVGYQLGAGRRDTYKAEDATSISDYGRQWMSLDLGPTSQVNTASEATTMGDGVLNDCKDPVVTAHIAMPYVWYLQLNDIIDLQPDDILSDTAYDLALIGESHFIRQGGGALSELVLEGSPNAGNRSQVQGQRKYETELRRPIIPFATGTSMLANGNFFDDSSV